MHGEVFVGGAESRNHVILEGSDGAFGDVAAVHVGWHQLDGDRGLFKKFGDLCRNFVVHDVKLWFGTGAKDGKEEFFVGLDLRVCCTVFDWCR